MSASYANDRPQASDGTTTTTVCISEGVTQPPVRSIYDLPRRSRIEHALARLRSLEPAANDLALDALILEIFGYLRVHHGTRHDGTPTTSAYERNPANNEYEFYAQWRSFTDSIFAPGRFWGAPTRCLNASFIVVEGLYGHDTGRVIQRAISETTKPLGSTGLLAKSLPRTLMSIALSEELSRERR